MGLVKRSAIVLIWSLSCVLRSYRRLIVNVLRAKIQIRLLPEDEYRESAFTFFGSGPDSTQTTSDEKKGNVSAQPAKTVIAVLIHPFVL